MHLAFKRCKNQKYCNPNEFNFVDRVIAQPLLGLKVVCEPMAS